MRGSPARQDGQDGQDGQDEDAGLHGEVLLCGAGGVGVGREGGSGERRRNAAAVPPPPAHRSSAARAGGRPSRRWGQGQAVKGSGGRGRPPKGARAVQGAGAGGPIQQGFGPSIKATPPSPVGREGGGPSQGAGQVLEYGGKTGAGPTTSHTADSHLQRRTWLGGVRGWGLTRSEQRCRTGASAEKRAPRARSPQHARHDVGGAAVVTGIKAFFSPALPGL